MAYQSTDCNTAVMHRHPWEKSYPSDVDWHAPIPVKPLHTLIEDAVAKYGDKPALDFMDRIYSFRQVGDLVARAAKGLQDLGVGKGTKVGLLLPNCPAFVISYYAVLTAGGTVVNYNPLYSEQQIKDQIEDSETDIMIALDLKQIYGKAAALLGQTRLKTIVVCPMAEQLAFPKNILFRLVKRKELARIPSDEKHVMFRHLIANDGRYEPAACDPGRDVAVLQYTGGTTGLPKGAMLTHANLYANVIQAHLYFPKTKLGEETMIGVLPFFHVFAMTVIMNFCLYAGAKMVLLPRFELETLLKTIHKKRPTFLPAVPTIYIAINHHPDVGKKYDLSSIHTCLSGGAALPRDVQETFEKLTGCTMVEGYGLSETSPVAVCNPPTGKSRPGSLGLPVPGTLVEIVALEDPTALLPQGEVGEICLSGPQVMLGYWKRSEVSEVIFAGGRFHTGDIGYIDEDGYVFLIDRLKEVIIAGGYNVYPRYVEEAIYKHPAVSEVTVVGVDDEYRQQTVKAFVKLRDGEQLDEEGLKSFLKDKLSPVEMPKQIEFRDELPKTLIGKLSKKELIAEEAAKRASADTHAGS